MPKEAVNLTEFQALWMDAVYRENGLPKGDQIRQSVSEWLEAHWLRVKPSKEEVK